MSRKNSVCVNAAALQRKRLKALGCLWSALPEESAIVVVLGRRFIGPPGLGLRINQRGNGKFLRRVNIILRAISTYSAQHAMRTRQYMQYVVCIARSRSRGWSVVVVVGR